MDSPGNTQATSRTVAKQAAGKTVSTSIGKKIKKKKKKKSSFGVIGLILLVLIVIVVLLVLTRFLRGRKS